MKKRRIIRKLQMLRNRSGVTMVELIVVFALISMFIALSSQVITSSLNVYAKIQGIDYGRQVSDTLMNKIVGELSGAQNNSLDEDAITIETDQTAITFWDESGSRIRITSGKPKHYSYNDDDETEQAGADYDTDMSRQLIIHYYVTKSGSKVVYQPVDWTFDENMYQGYEIESLKFSKADEAVYPPNMYCVELILNHPSYGRYAATRYVECYNFEGYEEPTEPTPETPTDPT